MKGVFIIANSIFFAEEVIIEVIPSASSAIDVNGNNVHPMDLQMPISLHLDHLHNIYVAAGTLACALLIVVLTVKYCFYCFGRENYLNRVDKNPSNQFIT